MRWSGTGSERELQVKIRRDAVVATAARLFNEFGYYATTLDDVAKELHVTKAALYYYVKDKDEILFECQKQALLAMRDALDEIGQHEISVGERLKHFLNAYAETLGQDYGKCLIRTGIRQLKPESRERVMPFVRQLDSGLLSLIEEGIAKGELRQNSARLVRNFIFGAFQGLTVWFNPDGEFSIEDVFTCYWELLAHGLFIAEQPTALPVSAVANAPFGS
nr:TetR/AcrR family transcriptional regulator [Sphingomonas sp. BGYR3]